MSKERICDESAGKISGGAMHLNVNIGHCEKCGAEISANPLECYRAEAEGEAIDDLRTSVGSVTVTVCKDCYEKARDCKDCGGVNGLPPGWSNPVWKEPEA